MTSDQLQSVRTARLELIDAGRPSAFLDWVLTCPPRPAEAEHAATVSTMEALVPSSDVTHHVTLHTPLPAGTKLYAEVPSNDPTTKAAYARMFGMACEDMGAIADSLGLNSDFDSGAEPILTAIENLRQLAGYADMHVFQMDDCEWWIGPSRCACLWAFAREYDTEVSSEEIAEDAPPLSEQQLSDLPFYADGESARTFADQLAIERAKGGEFPRLFATTEV